MEHIEIGRRLKNGNLKGEEGEPILALADSTIVYKSNGQWMEYNSLTNKEHPIEIPLL